MIHKWKHVPMYGARESYEIGLKWLEPCAVIEDWGAGSKFAKTLRPQGYVSVDCEDADVCTDLNVYRSSPDGIFMRHVLEHNIDWRVVLDNALQSFRRRMALIMFLPERASDEAWHGRHGKIPTIHIGWTALRKAIAPYVQIEHRVPFVQQQCDTVFLLEKP